MKSIASRIHEAVHLHERGDLQAAADAYRAILADDPDQADTLHLLGIVELQTGHIEAALTLVDRALRIRPGFAAAYSTAGVALHALGQHEKALANFDRALALDPAHPEALAQRDQVLRRMEMHAAIDRGIELLEDAHAVQALDSFDVAISLAPRDTAGWINRGIALDRLRRFDEALGSFDHAIGLDPNASVPRINRGTTLLHLRRIEDALETFSGVLASDPTCMQAWHNRGVALVELGRLNEARTSYARALELAPDADDVRCNAGMLDLLEARFASGWPLFESRLKLVPHGERRHDDVPRWDGQTPVAGLRILLWHEQGFGDTIQFIRYAQNVRALGARVVLEVQPALKRLVAAALPDIEVIATGEPTGSCDLAAALMSLPLFCGIDASHEAKARAYLTADTALAAAWRAKLGTDARPRIAFVVSGSTAHANDANRSIPVAHLASLLTSVASRAQCLVLQRELRDDDRHTLASLPGIRHIGDELGDFAETAALLATVDLVISVDTAIAHLAGALGKPVWILVPANPDWRWELDRDDCRWYASATLVRQTQRGDWRDAIGRMANALDVWLAHRG